eukprot:gene8351-9803_t
MEPLVALVTGSNKGIGYWIAKNLKLNQVRVILTSRDAALGKKAQEEFEQDGMSCDYVQLDITNTKSIDAAVDYVKRKYNRIDILVNNAGIAINRDFNYDLFSTTFKTNYFGTLDVIDRFLPVLANGGVIVNVSSSSGSLNIVSEELQCKLESPVLTADELAGILKGFDESIQNGTHVADGWPNSGYATSKLFLTVHTRLLAEDRRLLDNNISIFSMCPGYCRTDMTNQSVLRTASQGSKMAVNLALKRVDGAQSGGFYKQVFALSSVDFIIFE